MRLDSSTAEIVLFLQQQGYWVNHPIEAEIGDEQARISLTGNRHAIVTRNDGGLHAEYERTTPEETRFPTKVRVVIAAEGGRNPEQLAWIKANQGKVVSGKMVCWDTFRPDAAPVVLHADEYEVIESTTEWRDSPEYARSDRTIHRFDYKPGVFRSFFTTPFEQYKEHLGEHFTVVKQLPDSEAEEGGQGEDMYLIRFDDGTEIEAWGHEVCVLNYRKCLGNEE